MTLQLQIATHSEVGLVRKNNQDSGYASPHLLVVADGMGGAAAGDLASAVAIDTLRRIDSPTSGEKMLEVLAGAIHKANARIADLVEANLSLDGMGTTVTSAMFDGTELGLAHIGDSRAYLLRDGRLERLTHDHSWVQSLVDEGKINENEAAVHPHRSLLLKVLNGQPANDPDLTMVPVRAGDRLLFCSDGVCGLIDDQLIEECLLTRDRDHALARLLKEAHAEGGVDNITIILADVAEAETDTAVAADTSSEVVVLGAAAELAIPAAAATHRGNGTEDTIVNERPAADLPEGPEDEARYNPVPPRRRRYVRPLVGLVVLVLIATAAVGTAYAWTRTQYFVGVAGEQVAIYQGLSQRFPGVQLSHVYEVQPLAVSQLPPYYQDKVRASIDVSSLESARQTVTELAEAAHRCAGQTPGGKPSASSLPTPAASGTPSARPSGTPRPNGTPKPSTAPRPSPTSAPEQSC
jgi:serine/threonine protein phosphatase PrpC